MRCFEINGLRITAKSKEEAEYIESVLYGSGRRLVFVPDKGEAVIIDLPTDTVKIYSQDGQTVAYIGQLLGGVGQQILSAAIGNIDQSAKAAGKLAAQRRKIAVLAKEKDYKRNIAEFEGQIPKHHLPWFKSLMDEVCSGSLAYRVQMYQEIGANVEVNPENWFHILGWFQSKVLKGTATLYQKRKAFVTAVIRMGAAETGVANSIKDTKDLDDPGFWDKYLGQG